MNFSDLAVRLNQLNTPKIACDCGKNHALSIRFFGGVYTETLKEVLSEYAPYGRVAFVAQEMSYLKFAKPISDQIKGLGGRFVGLEVQVPSTPSVDDLGVLFNLPDDIRLLVTTDRELYIYCEYFCSIRNIPIVVIPQEVDLSFVPTTTAYLKNGDKLDAVCLQTERIVLLDANLISTETIATAYAFVISKLSALVDYRLFLAISGTKPCKIAYDLAKRAVITAYNIMNTQKAYRQIKLLEASFMLGYANAITKGAFYDFSAQTTACKLYGKDSGYNSLLFSIKILGVYDLAFYGGKKLLSVPDYNAHAKKFAKLYPVPLSLSVSAMLNQLKLLRKGNSKQMVAIRTLKPEIKSNLKLQSAIFDTFYALGGKTETIEHDKFITAIKHAGDCPFFLNGMSLAREKGVLELLD